MIDPSELVIRDNVRVDPQLDKEFIASIRERGVLTPVSVYQGADGALVVTRGHRRTLVAVQTGRESVPYHLVAQPGEVDRIIDQMAENGHRAGLTATERLAGFEQLAVLGLTAGQIAKRTATKRPEVDKALTVMGSQMAKEHVALYTDLTLDQAVVIAEFEDAGDRHRPGQRRAAGPVRARGATGP